MDRCAVLVDAGYLLSTAAMLHGAGGDRSALYVDYPALVTAIIEEAEVQTALPVLRVLWYDGSKGGIPTREHRALRLVPDVKVRLGETVRRGGRVVQKGVDSFLQRDLATLARNRAVCDVVLVGGDEDLRRGVEEAQDWGVRVHLWGVERATKDHNQSRTLMGEADRCWEIPSDFIREYVKLREQAPTPEPEPGPIVETSDPERAGAVRLVAESEASERAVSPADIARLAAAFREGGRPALLRRSTVYDASIPRLADITSPEEEKQDDEVDKVTPPDDPQEIGRIFGERWGMRAEVEQLEELLVHEADRAGGIPKHLDGELLRYAGYLGVDTWGNADVKFAVRDGFWVGLKDAAERREA